MHVVFETINAVHSFLADIQNFSEIISLIIIIISMSPARRQGVGRVGQKVDELLEMFKGDKAREDIPVS